MFLFQIINNAPYISKKISYIKNLKNIREHSLPAVYLWQAGCHPWTKGLVWKKPLLPLYGRSSLQGRLA